MPRGKLLSIDQLAEYLGVSRDTIVRRWESWGLHPVRIGRQVRFTEFDVDRFLKRARIA